MVYKSKNDLVALKTGGHEFPCVSMIFPFDIRYGGEHELHTLLKLKSNQLHHALSKEFSEDTVSTILKRYADLSTHIKFHSFISGYAFYLSSSFANFFELRFKPKEKLIIDDNFEIRDVLIDHSKSHHFIILLLSENEEKFFKYEAGTISPLAVHVPKHIEAFMQNTLHDVDIYYEKSARQEKARDLFIRNADTGLDTLYASYPWPVIVIAPNKFLAHYKLKSKHQEKIIGSIEGNMLESTESELMESINKIIPVIDKSLQAKLIARIEKADDDRLLCYGVKEVWKELSIKNGKELILEENFIRSAIHSDVPGEVFTYDAEKAHFPIQDALDDIIEMTLAAGGEVRFVEDGLLGKYRRVALIKYYAS